MKAFDTIYALSSGAGMAGVAVVRISGPKARAIVKALAGSVPRARVATLTRLARGATQPAIDRGIVIWFPAPRSFTGEDVAEFHVHGGRAVIEALFAALGSFARVRTADPGEFTRRAFGNGKFDLVEVEGLADLIEATTESQRRQALYHFEGGASRAFGLWRAEIIAILARLEAAIDFIDEPGVSDVSVAQALPRIAALQAQIAMELERGKEGQRLRTGLRVVLAGPPNAGKSSLLNQLARKDAAIVSPIAGTTRDVVEVHLNMGGLPVILQDTAGMRGHAADPVEQMGMARTSVAVAGADLVVWIDAADADEPSPPETAGAQVLRIWNKSDLGGQPLPGSGAGARMLSISCKDGSGIDELGRLIVERLRARLSVGEPSLVTRQRHRECLERMAAHLGRAVAGGRDPLEVVTEEIRLAAREVGRLTGHIDVENLLDEIFRDFCIGK
jgi:tRNA modification GTPase